MSFSLFKKKFDFVEEKNQSLGLKIALISLCICFIVGSIVCWYMGQSLTKLALKEQQERLNNKAELASFSASVALWNFDEDAINSLVTGLIEDPAVQAVTILNEDKEVIAHKSAPEVSQHTESLFDKLIRDTIVSFTYKHLEQISIDLFYKTQTIDGFSKEPVGMLIVDGSIEYQIEDITVLVSYLAQSIFTISAIIFFTTLLVTYLYVTKPLSLISKNILALDPDTPSQYEPVKVSRFNKRDEIAHIAKTLKMFVRRLVSSNKQIKSSEQRFKDLLENSLQGFVVTDEDNKIVYSNTAAAKIFGYDTAEDFINLGDYAKTFVDPNDLISLNKMPKEGHIHFAAEKRLRHDGTPIFLDTNINTIEWHGSLKKQAVMLDVSYQIQAEKELRSLATRDTLTGLPNRTLIIEHITQKARISHKHNFYILYFDISSFHKINELLSREVGDEILIEISQRLQKLLGEDCTLGHLGGGHFILLSPPNLSHRQLNFLRDEILETLKFKHTASHPDSPQEKTTYNLDLEATFSACVYPKDGQDAEILLSKCEQLNKHAKQEKLTGIEVFDPELDKKLLENIQMEKQISSGIENNEFFLLYQPKVDADSEQPVGCEALVRWQTPQGPIYPDQFIPIAEESRQIIPLGTKIMHLAGEQIAKWRDQHFTPGHVAINVSAVQLLHGDVYGDYQDIVERYSLNPGDVQIEITESTTLQQLELITPMLAKLREAGATIAIDDFGTGYSSLSYLKELPVTHLKLDRSFVKDLPESDALAIAKAISGLGHALNLTIIAEGVETKEQANYLKSLGYDQFQGYLYAKPLQPEQYSDFLNRISQNDNQAIPDIEQVVDV
ncbi:bifunctional diguanylate cyclase/phosphodiesterase [Kiloniella sp. EL199]|uniref:sensor domain-containing protein n=1 Tax=Kiloniella sp. EL199 TaxID=2107581 RepID=UPI000EA3DF29|nr:bifunctional diguanylate cyclase/phosphodiesterase [Kiloniella sp. EL199]